jgi:hypothetical protein
MELDSGVDVGVIWVWVGRSGVFRGLRKLSESPKAGAAGVIAEDSVPGGGDVAIDDQMPMPARIVTSATIPRATILLCFNSAIDAILQDKSPVYLEQDIFMPVKI